MTRFFFLLVVCLAAAVTAPSMAAAEEADGASPAAAASTGPGAAQRPLVRRWTWESLHCEPPRFCCPGPPVFGYDGNFYVRDRCARFTFLPSAFTQLRWTWNERTSAPVGESLDTYDLEFSRTRLSFQGQATKRFDYDFVVNIDHTGDVETLAANLTWNLGKGWTIQAGQLFLAVTREDWANPQDTLTTDFSANDLVFAPGVGQGGQVHWQGTRDRAWLASSNDRFQGGNHVVGATGKAKWAVTGRYEHQFCTTDWSIWDDLVGRRGRPWGVLVGLGGGVGQGDASSPIDLEYMLTADASLNWSGGQALVSGIYRNIEGKDGVTADQWGLLAQAGQFVTPTVDFYGRYELVSPGDSPGGFDTYQSLTVGCSYLPFRWTNKFRLWAEFSYLFTPLSRTIVPGGGLLGFLPSDEDQFYVRLQLQFGF